VNGLLENVDKMDLSDEELYSGDGSNLDVSNGLDDLVYIMYTSGSTGKPKGVQINHRNLLTFFEGMRQRLEPSTQEAFFAMTSISFDPSVMELLWTLAYGVQVVLNVSDTTQYERLDRYVEQGDLLDIDFSLFFFSSYDHDQEAHAKYQLLLDTTRFADQNDFQAVWIPERHFHEFGGLYPNPSVICSALSMVTEKIAIRSGSVVSPLHPSLRIAEDWSVVDNLSKGRVGLSFAAGWIANDFVLNSEAYSARKATMFQQIEEVKRLWGGGTLELTNGLGQNVKVQTFPRPIQKELPVWVTSSGNPETFKEAGKIGANVLTHMLGQNVEDLERNIRLYKESLEASGYEANQGKVTVMLHTFIGEDNDEVKRLVKEPFCEYLRTSTDLIATLAKGLGMDVDPANAGKAMDELIEIGFERYWQTAALLGSRETCSRLLGQLSRIGVQEIACLIDFGLSPELVMEGLQRLNAWREDIRREKAENIARKYPIRTIQCTPSRLRMLLEDPGSQRFLRSLRTILVGGEALTLKLVQEVRRRTDARIFNLYGPTETTVWSSLYEVKNPSDPIVLGEPIMNRQFYVLDPNRKVVPIGVIGEIYIGGDGVSPGYMDKELNAGAFVDHPYHEGKVLYRTGDMGRYLPNGMIEYRGRNDNQVKIRGYRVELGEVEKVLLSQPGVRAGVVLVKEDEKATKRLVAYLEVEEGAQQSAIREGMKQTLPHYMIPSIFVMMDKLPLNPNGKIHRKMLPEPHERWTGETKAKRVPETELERQVAQIWEQTL
ncbi:MupA/Atu3671 family FMN-dependent luciferase-like monooxygenase, partial [Paenibacillus glucanolyticus]|uniref:MupA/Atu3671 family FMN-dependent luciferase-like monooxygenase n=1 Tax=Paenibacillus glucanolyticus TaxID=59843 RepID=UPI003673DA5F